MDASQFLYLLFSFILVTSHSVENLNKTTSNVAEGGPIAFTSNVTHMLKVNHSLPNEHMIKLNYTQNTSYVVGQKNDNKNSVPKKDAILVKESINITKSTTTTAVPHKPVITEGEDEPPSKNQSNNTKKHPVEVEILTEKTRKIDYVVPIVVVIMSVPLVAILFSILYKRGADWWQHRHYRRMDFLIEGMYNN